MTARPARRPWLRRLVGLIAIVLIAWLAWEAAKWPNVRTLATRRILECYLNVVEFGPGVYGVEAASRRYFGKAAAELNEDEAARLAAGLPRPRAWHPGVSSPAYRRYAESIRHRMERAELSARLLQ